MSITEVGLGLRPHEFDALVRFNDTHRGRYFEVGHKHLRTRSFVGYIEVGNLAIEILPKADRDASSPAAFWRDGLLDMLCVALGLRLKRLSGAGQKLTRNRLLDLIAQAYLAELDVLLREGLAKGYRTTQSNGAVFRGRLKIPEHLRENVARADQFFVEYQTFDPAGSRNSDLTISGNSDHPGASSDRRGPSIAVANRRGKAKDDRHGQKARDPGPAASRTQPGRDGHAGRRVAKQRPARRG